MGWAGVGWSGSRLVGSGRAADHLNNYLAGVEGETERLGLSGEREGVEVRLVEAHTRLAR